jgi:hypothetical protein
MYAFSLVRRLASVLFETRCTEAIQYKDNTQESNRASIVRLQTKTNNVGGIIHALNQRFIPTCIYTGPRTITIKSEISVY